MKERVKQTGNTAGACDGGAQRLRCIAFVRGFAAVRLVRRKPRRLPARLATAAAATTPAAAAAISALCMTAARDARAAPLNYFLHAAGPAARPTMYLGWALAALVTAVMVIVAALLVVGVAKRRAPAANDRLPPDAGGMQWIYIGTGISAVALFGALVYMLVTLDSVAAPSRPPALTVSVTAYDWWWKVDYRDPANPARDFATANEIHIPVGEPVKIELRSADVIHAFWVPQLAGKTQTIPGRLNEQWIEADAPGVYRGQCSQFCGAQHAHMAFEVVAEDRAAFDAWWSAQAAPHAAATSTAARAGARLFEARCAGCHTVRGTPSAGAQAPDLTHLGSRRLIAAGALSNTPEHQLDWIRHAQRIKPDGLMPSIALNAQEAEALSAYLATLQ